MSVVAYACIDPYLDQPPTADTWGETVEQVYLDQGSPNNARPQLQHLLQNCQTMPPDRLLVRQLVDFGDSLEAIFARVDHLEQQGITVISLDGKYVTPARCQSPDKPSDGGDRASLIDLAADLQATLRQRQLQAGHAANRVNAMPPPGRAPYGYRRGRYRYALDRTTAPVVKEFFERFLLFGSVRGAVRYLEKTYGKRISASTGQRWLTHPVYRGDSLYKDGNIIRDTHTPIISREEAAQIDRLLRRNRRLPPKTASAERSLAGLVRCQECQSKLRVSRVTRPRQTQDYLYLRPMSCSRTTACKAIPYEAVLERTIAAICQDLPAAVADLQAPPVGIIKGAIAAQIEQKENALAQLPQLQQQGILDEATISLRAYTLRSEISELQQRISQLPPENLLQIVQTLSIPRFWQDLSEAERRVYLREFIHTVLITRQADDWDVQIRFVFNPQSSFLA